MTKPIPQDIRNKLAPLMGAIGKLFATPLVTVIIRAPHVANVTGDLVLSSDNPTEVLAVVKHHMVAEAQRLAATKESPDGR
jgi:hypothetical protein